MSFNKLPLEVIEEIFQNLGIEDMMNAWEAVGLDGSESYWGKVCRREGYNKVDGVDDTWRSVVNRNLNWRFRRFVRREYVVDENPHFPNRLHFENTRILTKDPEVPKLGVLNIISSIALRFCR
uniref:F-box domain-containing protein n=1 Tax=Cuerna arida TaxID=1464854 RepID=A0A1B6F1P6_9HEMI